MVAFTENRDTHERTKEWTFRETEQARGLWLWLLLLSCVICVLHLSLFLFFFVFQEKDGERETDFMTVMVDGKCTDDDDDNDDACVALVSLCRSLA